MKEHLVLVPGIDGTGKLFYRQIPGLERRFTVTPIRLRDDAQTMDDLVADLHDEIARLAADGGPVSLLGESFGGALTLSYAIAHPERVERLVILNSFAHFGSQARLWLGYHLLRATPWGMMRLVRQLNAHRLHSPRATTTSVSSCRRSPRRSCISPPIATRSCRRSSRRGS
jgi:3-oxoadipate enol-lactonase